MKKEIKTPRGFGYGSLETDAGAIRQFMKKLGCTDTWLAKEANVSQQQINRFRNGQRNLSPAASDRVIRALQAAWEAKNGSPQAEALSPAAAGRIRDEANAPGEREQLSVYSDLIETATFGEDPQLKRDLYEFLAGPPRERGAYEQWKSKATKILISSSVAPKLFDRNKELAKQVSELMEADSAQKEIISNLKEVASLYKGWVGRLQQQLRDAGITPID